VLVSADGLCACVRAARIVHTHQVLNEAVHHNTTRRQRVI
jgi:hypothetical protein